MFLTSKKLPYEIA